LIDLLIADAAAPKTPQCLSFLCGRTAVDSGYVWYHISMPDPLFRLEGEKSVRVQKVNWGYIEWLTHTSEQSLKNNPMSVGIVVILPGKHQQPHIHYGEEQFLYILQGDTLQVVDGKEYRLSQGEHLYIPCGSKHETFNMGTTEVHELMISQPVTFAQNTQESLLAQTLPKPPTKPNLYAAVEAVRTQIKSGFRAPFTIFDDRWQIVLQNDYFSDFCAERCSPSKDPYKCDCLQEEAFLSMATKMSCFTCPHGMRVYDLALSYAGTRLGTIRGGHFLYTRTGDSSVDAYDTPESSVKGFENLMHQLVRSIEAYLEFDSVRQALLAKDKAILETRGRQELLQRDLRLTQETAANLRINHHFLFNTLNCIAEMALSQRGEDVYTAILRLANMLRYTMNTDGEPASLQEEWRHLKNYVDLQILRYGKRVSYTEAIDPEVMDILIPFNSLQPIVENAFIHGMKESGNSTLSISLEAVKDGEKALITVHNTGAGIDEITLRRINKGLKSNSGHGLSLVYSKLASQYGNDFSMDVTSDEKNETWVSIRIPIRRDASSLGH